MSIGTFKAITTGSVTVTATYSGHTGTTTTVVSAVGLDHLDYTLSSSTATVGGSVPTGTVTKWQDAGETTPFTGSVDLNYTSSNTSVCTIGFTNGVIALVGAGTCTFTVHDNVSGKSATTGTLTVSGSGSGAPATGLTATLNADNSVSLAWTDGAGTTSYTVQEDGVTIGTVAQGTQAFRTKIGGGDPTTPRFKLPLGWTYDVTQRKFVQTNFWNKLPGEGGLTFDLSAYPNVVRIADSGNRATNATNLQNAINTAYSTAGHTIIFLQGSGSEWASLTGEIQVPLPSGANNGTYWCVLADQRLDPTFGTAFPRAAGARVQVGDNTGMPKFSVGYAPGTGGTYDSTTGITTGGRPYSAFNLALGCTHFATVGIEFRYDASYDPGSATDRNHPGMNEGFFNVNHSTTDGNGNYVELFTSASTYPSYIVIDRCDAHGPGVGKAMTRPFMIHGHHIAVTNSRAYNVGSGVTDSQCFVATTGAGPYNILNNYLATGYGEGVMFGGGSSIFESEICADIAVVGNHFDFPPAMKAAGYTTKNLFEIKTGLRVLVAGNVFEHYINDGEQFFYINIKAVSQNAQDHDANGRWWDLARDVTIWGNMSKDCSGLWQLSDANTNPGPDLHRVEVRNNTAFVPDNSSGLYVPGQGHEWAIQIGGKTAQFDWQTKEAARPRDISVRHNTLFVPTGTIYFTGATEAINAGYPIAPLTRYDIRDNVVVYLSVPSSNPYWSAVNINHSPNASNQDFLDYPRDNLIWGPNAIIGSAATAPILASSAPNVLDGVDDRLYPDTTTAGVNSDGSLTSSSPLKGTASDGADMGADLTLVTATIAGADTGNDY